MLLLLLDYYWRDYKGIVPQDAILGGRDKYNQPTFIGQALIKEGGIMPCTIYNGNKTVDVEYYGHLKTDTHVKVLRAKPRTLISILDSCAFPDSLHQKAQKHVLAQCNHR